MHFAGGGFARSVCPHPKRFAFRPPRKGEVVCHPWKNSTTRRTAWPTAEPIRAAVTWTVVAAE